MTNKQKAKKYLTKLLSEGAKEIRVVWEGGNDEGSFYLYVDEKEVDVDYTKNNGTYDLIDYIAGEIGYGSFAGDFSTNGEVIYDIEKGAFIGDDSYEEQQEFTYKLRKHLVLTIPKDLWFDTIEVDMSGYDGDLDTSVRLSITNGPVVQEHIDFESKSVEALQEVANQLFDDVDEVRDLWISEAPVKREDLSVDKDGNPYHAVTNIIYSKYVGEDKEIVIQL
jgi:hypothetical protein